MEKFSCADVDHLAGYECDNVNQGYTPASWVTLGTANCESFSTQPGMSTMGAYGNPSFPPAGVLFNAATTDWTRVLTCPNPNLNTVVVQRITQNVICFMSGIEIERRMGRDEPPRGGWSVPATVKGTWA